jgi:prophage DNA circulation protein
MVDSPEVIRQQMEETRQQLAEKLETLEHQVSETVQSTGTAVSATVGAVQETVETVAEAVQDAVRAVTDVFDIRHHVKAHPWFFLGGSLLAGYIIVDFLRGTRQQQQQHYPRQSLPPLPLQTSQTAAFESGQSAFKNDSPDYPALAPSGLMESSNSQSDSPWHQLKAATTSAIVHVIQDAASRVVPQAVEFLHRTQGAANSPQPKTMPAQKWQRGPAMHFENVEDCRIPTT